MILLLVALLGALGRRAAGGMVQQWTGYNTGDLPVRAVFGLTVALAALLGGSWWLALIAAPAVFLGCSIPVNIHIPLLGNFGGIHFAASDRLPLWRRTLGLLAHGFGNLAGVIAGAVWLHVGWPLVGLGAAAIVPAYALGWRLTGDAGLPWMPVGLRGGSELGEAFWGAAVALSVYLSA